MSIHVLSYQISKNAHDERAPALPLFEVVIDGYKEPYSFHIFPLELSAKQEGNFPILNCTCGEFGCGGDYVKVRHEDGVIIWENIHARDSDKSTSSLHLDTPISFLRISYESLVAELLREKEKSDYDREVYAFDKKTYQETSRFVYK